MNTPLMISFQPCWSQSASLHALTDHYKAVSWHDHIVRDSADGQVLRKYIDFGSCNVRYVYCYSTQQLANDAQSHRLVHIVQCASTHPDILPCIWAGSTAHTELPPLIVDGRRSGQLRGQKEAIVTPAPGFCLLRTIGLWPALLWLPMSCTYDLLVSHRTSLSNPLKPTTNVQHVNAQGREVVASQRSAAPWFHQLRLLRRKALPMLKPKPKGATRSFPVATSPASLACSHSPSTFLSRQRCRSLLLGAFVDAAMDEAAPIVHESTDSFYNASMFFNASLKLAHRFLSLPSRALARLRRLDDLALDLHEAAQQHPYATTSGNGQRRSRGHISSGPPVPGMWGFLTSGYFLGLFIMAFVLNRIQNIVVPPRRPPGFRIHHNSFNMHARLSWRRLFLSWLFPVDLSSTRSRLLFRIPSMYLLGKAFTLWAVLLVQAAGPPSLSQAGWMQPLFAWVAEKKTEDICWYTFLSACATLCIGTLTTGLEGLNMNDSSPFNLFAFAFQLYVCAASHSYAPKEGEPPSRPDVHVIITIMLPLIQLVVMHCLEVKQRWTQYRLVLSTTIGLLALIHFHSVVCPSCSQ
ncbi:hypothetical protein NUW54_g9623 [Trametes sanguinea]|uniref:Uncharacterized protein n=1 Tax=Trametes sanguinea TaxID=158606 RepID=A0ACC1P5C7_9APHY|nr:hypothetical protein NUW54_g9623 [Trametes sanguinea]